MMVIKIWTLRKSLYLGFVLVVIIKSSWTYRGTLIIIGGGCLSEVGVTVWETGLAPDVTIGRIQVENVSSLMKTGGSESANPSLRTAMIPLDFNCI